MFNWNSSRRGLRLFALSSLGIASKWGSGLYSRGNRGENNDNEVLLEIVLGGSFCPGYWTSGLRRRQWAECRGGSQPKQQQFGRAGELLLRETPGAAAECA